MTPLISILIPSRGRPKRLFRAVESCVRTASGNNFEVRIRIDSDDEATKAMLDSDAFSKMTLGYNVHVHTGERGRGWYDNHFMLTELACCSVAPWCWMFNDDATLEGNTWLEQLALIEPKLTVVWPQWHQNGGSRYEANSRGPFPVFVNQFWKDYNLDSLQSPADTWVSDMADRYRWNVVILKDVTTNHQRDNDSTIRAHRQ